MFSLLRKKQQKVGHKKVRSFDLICFKNFQWNSFEQYFLFGYGFYLWNRVLIVTMNISGYHSILNVYTNKKYEIHGCYI